MWIEADCVDGEGCKSPRRRAGARVKLDHARLAEPFHRATVRVLLLFWVKESSQAWPAPPCSKIDALQPAAKFAHMHAMQLRMSTLLLHGQEHICPHYDAQLLVPLYVHMSAPVGCFIHSYWASLSYGLWTSVSHDPRAHGQASSDAHMLMSSWAHELMGPQCASGYSALAVNCNENRSGEFCGSLQTSRLTDQSACFKIRDSAPRLCRGAPQLPSDLISALAILRFHRLPPTDTNKLSPPSQTDSHSLTPSTRPSHAPSTHHISRKVMIYIPQCKHAPSRSSSARPLSAAGAGDGSAEVFNGTTSGDEHGHRDRRTSWARNGGGRRRGGYGQCDEALGDGLAESVELRDVATTLDAEADVDVGELVRAGNEDGLVDLVAEESTGVSKALACPNAHPQLLATKNFDPPDNDLPSPSRTALHAIPPPLSLLLAVLLDPAILTARRARWGSR
ncbi:unnamed protein product [Cutaneotrichosporon oleaginosum]